MTTSTKHTIEVHHAYYGCETGCCGLFVTVGDRYDLSNLDFMHLNVAWEPEPITEEMVKAGAIDFLTSRHPQEEWGSIDEYEWIIRVNLEEPCEDEYENYR